MRPEVVTATLREKGLTEKAFLLSLVESASKLARPPLSKFYVGAAGLGVSGAVYLGVNLEFPGVPLYNTVHAEQFLVVNAIQHGEKALKCIGISAGPCGHCRQFFSELHNAECLKLFFVQGERTEWTLQELLPHRFKPQDVLGSDVTTGLMSPTEGVRLEWTEEAAAFLQRRGGDVTKAAEAARVCASESYVPYSRCLAGVSILTRRGEVFGGGSIEVCAYNPSLPPLQSAIIRAITNGKMQGYSEIVQAVVVERAAPVGVSHTAAVRALLASIAPEAKVTLLTVRDAA